MALDFQYPFLSVLLAAVIGFFFFRRRRMLRNVQLRKKFVGKHSATLEEAYLRTEKIRRGLYVAVLITAVLVLMRPLGSPIDLPTLKKNRDIILLLDVSRSMLANDVIPNRLEKARQIIRDLVSSMNGERVALVIFAGTAVTKSPLTSDYFFFLKALDSVSADQVSKGGSEIGTAIEYVFKVFFAASEEAERQNRNIILITDGDNLSSEPLAAARQAAEQQTVIHTISIGTSEGGRIPLPGKTGEYLTYNSLPVQTRPDNNTLRQIADITGGIFIPAGSANVKLGEIYREYFWQSAFTENESAAKTQTREEYYRPVLFVLIVLLLLDMFLRLRTKKRASRSSGSE